MMVRSTFLVGLIMLLGVRLIHAAEVGTLDIARLQSGVVKITSKSSEGTRRVGTGFLVKLEKEAAYIVTAAHVVAGDSDPKVEFFTKRNVSLPVEVLGLEGDDELRGLALLIVKGRENLPNGLMALSLASVIPSAEGVDIMVIGFPRNQGPWAVAKGNISSRQGRDLYFSPAVDEGYSGGPIIQSGKVIGMVGGTSQTVGRGVTVRSVQDYIEGFGITAQESTSTASTATESSPPPAAMAKLEPRHTTQDPEITGKDGAPMVLIHAGRLPTKIVTIYGNGTVEEVATPLFSLYVADNFYIDRQLVTITRFRQFLETTGHRLRGLYWEQRDWPADQNQAIDMVSWHDAVAYCTWARKRLPSEDEWEKAAHDTKGRILDPTVAEWTSSAYNESRFFPSEPNDQRQRTIRGSLSAFNLKVREGSHIDYQVRMHATADNAEAGAGFRCVRNTASVH